MFKHNEDNKNDYNYNYYFLYRNVNIYNELIIPNNLYL